MYLPLAATSLAVCVVFHRSISGLHLGIVATLGILAPLALGWLGGRFPPELEPLLDAEREPDGRFAWFAVGLFCVACAKHGILGFLSSGFVPSLHDEWSYLFGAKTFVLGRLTNPPPPLPEFFDAFHILTTPHWVTRYPPGHPAMLAIGILAGWPAAMVIGLTAGSVVWIYFLGRELGGAAVGKLAGVLAIMAPGIDFLASGYLSQSTFLCTMMGCYYCAIRSLREVSPFWSAAAGTLAGWAILTRPYSAAALGLPLAVWFVWQAWRELSEANHKSENNQPFARLGIVVFCAVLPLAIALGLFAMYNEATTGSPWRTAWEEYNRQFEPDNTLGFSPGIAQPIPPGMSERKALKARTIAVEKLRFTWPAALRRAVADPQRLSDMIFPAIGFYGLIALIPFGVRAPAQRPIFSPFGWLLLAALAMHYLAYSYFYSTWGVYGHETIPFVILLVACGSVEFWRRARDSDRPAMAATVPLVLLAALAVDGRDLSRFVQRRQEDTKYHREFAHRLNGLATTPAIVFVRLDPSRRHEYDLINNPPDQHAPVLVVLDLGERNAELLAAFPQRSGYIYDEATGNLTPWSPPTQVVPAKWPAPRMSPIASRP